MKLFIIKHPIVLSAIALLVSAGCVVGCTGEKSLMSVFRHFPKDEEMTAAED